MSFDYTINEDYKLAPEQNEVIPFLLRRNMGVNSLQTGLGKTYSSLVAAEYVLQNKDDYEVIIICPGEANKAWKKELTKGIKRTFNMITATESRTQRGAKYSIYNFSSLGKYKANLMKRIKGKKVLCILDECHILQNPESQVYQLMALLRSSFHKLWGVTATPLLNHIEGFFHMVNLISPGFLGSFEQFKSNYVIYRKRTVRQGGKRRIIFEVSGYRNLDVLNHIIKDLIMIRKRKYNLEFHYLRTALTPAELVSYRKAGAGLLGIDFETGLELKREMAASRLHDLQKVVDNAHPQFTLTHNKLSNKEKLLCSIVKKCNTSLEPVLVYCEYHDTLDRLQRVLEATKLLTGLKKIYVISGKIPQKDRVAIEDLIEPGVVVLVTKAGTRSINLQLANSVVFYDIPFAVGDFIQMVGRVARMDSGFDIQNIYLLEAFGTIDTYKRMRVQDNASLINEVLGGNENLPVDLLTLDLDALQELRKKLLWSTQSASRASRKV